MIIRPSTGNRIRLIPVPNKEARASVATPGASALALKVGDIMSNDPGVYRNAWKATYSENS
jgi:hypothetical protein